MVATSEESVTYLTLLKNGNFLRFFLAQSVSSLGDWVGVIAIASLAYRNFGNGGVGLIMSARVLPGFFVGPLTGVLADRWDRKKTMVLADISRAVIVFSLPFVPNLAYFLLASALLESLTLAWGPAKDAALPHFVPKAHLTHANSLSLIAIYGPWPLATVVFALLAGLGNLLGDRVAVLSGLSGSPESLALWTDSVTFAFSAVMISTLAIPVSKGRLGKFDLAQVKRDLVEGLTFVRDHPQVRPWMLGIAITFTAAGAVFSLGPEFVTSILGSGPTGFGFVIGFFGTGMMVGLLAAGLLIKRMKKDVLFSASILLLGAGLIALASMSSLTATLPIAGALGFFAGVGYSVGYSLMQETTEDELRGRTFSAAYTLIRIGTLGGLGFFPLVADRVQIGTVQLPGDATLALPGSRVTLWLAGLLVIVGGVQSLRAIRDREVAQPAPSKRALPGYFVVFEGGEGAGKSTQMTALVKWLEARGNDVVETREPGATRVGERIRGLLLDPGATDLDERAEALLYAADRAQHVAEVIRPALAKGKIVVSDRFVDSSLAYQGAGRELGVERVLEISKWATGGLMPDLVFLLKVDSVTALERIDGERDRLEREDAAFHERIEGAYAQLARQHPDRFAVIDANRTPSEVHEDVKTAFGERLGEATDPGEAIPLRPQPNPVVR